MRSLLLITDAWAPQTNGVVTTWQSVCAELEHLGMRVTVVHPAMFTTLPMPGYPEIRLATNPWRMASILEAREDDFVHITTEGPLGLYARAWLKRRGISFTTSSHTKFPEYINERIGLPLSAGYAFVRWFHGAAARTLCRTPTHMNELASRGLTRLEVWAGGVDTERFRPQSRRPRRRPVLLYVGRIAIEKNVEAFLELDCDADKVVVGDGPQRRELQKRYPGARWRGLLKGQALVDSYAQADVLVFPSKTDTFGLVMIEANACGTPVAAFPVTGPLDVVQEGVSGSLRTNLADAVRASLALDRARCRVHAEGYGWRSASRALIAHIAVTDCRHNLLQPR